MSEMVERIARLICEYNGDDPDHLNKYIGSMPDGFEWELQAPLARQIIAAMREPTQEMRHRIWDCLEKNASAGNCKPGAIRGNGMPDVFLGMIVDEALKP